MLGGDIGDRFHELLVFALGVVHQPHRGLRNGRERGGFARVVHAQLNGGNAVALAQTEQRERQADVVVEIAGGGKGVFGAPVLAQYRGDHFLHRGLAVRTGDGNERNVKAAAPVRGQAAKAAPGVSHHDARQAGLHGLIARLLVDHRRDGTSRLGRTEEMVAVEIVAAQGDEQRAGGYRARVGRDRAETHVGAAAARAQGRGGFVQAHHARPGVSAADAAAA